MPQRRRAVRPAAARAPTAPPCSTPGCLRSCSPPAPGRPARPRRGPVLCLGLGDRQPVRGVPGGHHALGAAPRAPVHPRVVLQPPLLGAVDVLPDPRERPADARPAGVSGELGALALAVLAQAALQPDRGYAVVMIGAGAGAAVVTERDIESRPNNRRRGQRPTECAQYRRPFTLPPGQPFPECLRRRRSGSQLCVGCISQTDSSTQSVSGISSALAYSSGSAHSIAFTE